MQGISDGLASVANQLVQLLKFSMPAEVSMSRYRAVLLALCLASFMCFYFLNIDLNRPKSPPHQLLNAQMNGADHSAFRTDHFIPESNLSQPTDQSSIPSPQRSASPGDESEPQLLMKVADVPQHVQRQVVDLCTSVNQLLTSGAAGVTADMREVLTWLCAQVGIGLTLTQTMDQAVPSPEVTSAVQDQAVPSPEVLSAVQDQAVPSPEVTSSVQDQAVPSPGVLSAVRDVCVRLRPVLSRLETADPVRQDVRRVVAWLCRQAGITVPVHPPAGTPGCNKYLMYPGFGRLGNMLSIYATVYAYSRLFDATGIVWEPMWVRIHPNFPALSLKSEPEALGEEDAELVQITYGQVESALVCLPQHRDGDKRVFNMPEYPWYNGLDVFHPFQDDIRKEFQFSPQLQQQAQEFLRRARGDRPSATYIGVHLRLTDYIPLVREKFNLTLPGADYFAKCFRYYRSRYRDALFVVSSDDMALAWRVLEAAGAGAGDVVAAGDGDLEAPARDMALLAACNHSVVTVGSFGFWCGYLAGGTVLVPEVLGQVLSERDAPLLETQLAGLDNFVVIR